MPNFNQWDDVRLRDGYSIEIVEEDDSLVAYFNSRYHITKRTKLNPVYSKDFAYIQILRDVYPRLGNRFGDIAHCSHCGR